MKKTLAILMVLMLVLLPMTAFAAAGTDGTSSFSNNKGGTEFNVEVNTANINVTVPLSLVFIADSNGGAFAPTSVPDNYEITNSSSIALKVTHITTGTLTTPAGSDPVTLSDTDQTTLSAGSTNINVFQIKLNGQAIAAATADVPVATPASWALAAGGTCPIAITGSNSPLDFTTDSAATLFTVTYTVAPV